MSDRRAAGGPALDRRPMFWVMPRLNSVRVLTALAIAGAAVFPAGAQAAATTASVMLHGGALAFVNGTPAATVSFPATTLDGTSKTVTASLVFDVSDATGSGAGWNVSATSTMFSSGANTLPNTATTIQSAPTIACDLLPVGCTLASTLVGYPYTLPAATVAPAPTPIFDALVGTGLGGQSFTTTWTLSIPAGAVASASPYTSTWTFSLASGP